LVPGDALRRYLEQRRLVHQPPLSPPLGRGDWNGFFDGASPAVPLPGSATPITIFVPAARFGPATSVWVSSLSPVRTRTGLSVPLLSKVHSIAELGPSRSLMRMGLCVWANIAGVGFTRSAELGTISTFCALPVRNCTVAVMPGSSFPVVFFTPT